jgi:hypothetical protein
VSGSAAGVEDGGAAGSTHVGLEGWVLSARPCVARCRELAGWVGLQALCTDPSRRVAGAVQGGLKELTGFRVPGGRRGRPCRPRSRPATPPPLQSGAPARPRGGRRAGPGRRRLGGGGWVQPLGGGHQDRFGLGGQVVGVLGQDLGAGRGPGPGRSARRCWPRRRPGGAGPAARPRWSRSPGRLRRRPPRGRRPRPVLCASGRPGGPGAAAAQGPPRPPPCPAPVEVLGGQLVDAGGHGAQPVRSSRSWWGRICVRVHGVNLSTPPPTQAPEQDRWTPVSGTTFGAATSSPGSEAWDRTARPPCPVTAWGPKTPAT